MGIIVFYLSEGNSVQSAFHNHHRQLSIRFIEAGVENIYYCAVYNF